MNKENTQSYNTMKRLLKYLEPHHIAGYSALIFGVLSVIEYFN